MTDRQPLAVTTTGGWARPGWWDLLEEGEAAGRFGPDDQRELYDDYCRLAIGDQEACGLDIVTDGEHRRRGWIENITAALPGITRRPSRRRLGALGYDMLDVWELSQPFDDLDRLWDFTGEYRFLPSAPTAGCSPPCSMRTCTGSAWSSARGRWPRSAWSAGGTAGASCPPD